jgi:formylglycine-generating enzyme required for sulfatase activity
MSEELDFQFILVPGSAFLIGSNHSDDPKATNDEMPQHELKVTDYHIMRHPVTNKQYYLFMKAVGHPMPRQTILWWGFPFWMQLHFAVGRGR